MDFINEVIAKVLNKENLTINNALFLGLAVLLVGKIVFSLVSLIFGGALTFILLLVATGIFAYRAAKDFFFETDRF